MNFSSLKQQEELSEQQFWGTVVSAINGCGLCVDAHEQVLHAKGFSEEKVLMAVRMASVLYAISGVLNAEMAH